MECKNIIKKNGIAYMVNMNNEELDIENFRNMDLFEKKNGIMVKDLLSEFIKSKDNNFNSIINTVEEMVDTYHIDYYVYGSGNEVSEDTVALLYNLKNRNSDIDCKMKVFYSERYNKISYMISFEGGANGKHFGYQFYRYFSVEDFYEIERMLTSYFTNDSSGTNDKTIINDITNNIKARINNFYS